MACGLSNDQIRSGVGFGLEHVKLSKSSVDGQGRITVATIQAVRSKLSSGASNGCCPVASSAAVLKLAEPNVCTSMILYHEEPVPA